MKVLLVDSSTAIIERLKSAITDANRLVDFFHASDEINAFKIVDEHDPVAVILDMNMPGKLSARLIKYLKEKNVKSFIIVLSIQSDQNLKMQSQLMGADVFLDKYHEFEKIPGIIKNIISRNLTN